MERMNEREYTIAELRQKIVDTYERNLNKIENMTRNGEGYTANELSDMTNGVISKYGVGRKILERRNWSSRHEVIRKTYVAIDENGEVNRDDAVTLVRRRSLYYKR